MKTYIALFVVLLSSCMSTRQGVDESYSMNSLHQFDQVEFGSTPYLDKVKLISLDSNTVIVSMINTENQHIEIWKIKPDIELVKSYNCKFYKKQYLSDYGFIGNDSLILSFLPSSVKENHNVAIIKVLKQTIIDTYDFKGLPITSSSNPELKRLHSVCSFPYYFPMLVNNNKVYTSFVPYFSDSMHWVRSSNPSFIYGINFSGSGIRSEALKSAIITDSTLNTLRLVPESYSLINGGFLKDDKLYYGYSYDHRIFVEDLRGKNEAVVIETHGPIEDVVSTSQKAGINNSFFDSQDLFRFGLFVLATDSNSIIRLNRIQVEKDNIYESNYPLHMLQIIPLSGNSSKNSIALIPSGYTDHVLIPIDSGVILYNKKESTKRGKIVLDFFRYTENNQQQSYQQSLTNLRSLPSHDSSLNLNEYLKKRTGLKSLAGKTIILINEDKACEACVNEFSTFLQKDWLCDNNKIYISFVSKNDSSNMKLTGKCSIFNTLTEDIEKVLMPWNNILRLDFDENGKITQRRIYSAGNLNELKLFISTKSE